MRAIEMRGRNREVSLAEKFGAIRQTDFRCDAFFVVFEPSFRGVYALKNIMVLMILFWSLIHFTLLQE